MDKCPENLALFPALRDQDDGYYTSNGIRMLKSIVEKETGVRFDLRACRRTYAQKAIDEGLSPQGVSKMIGHRYTMTTERYYCRMRQEDANQAALKLWNQSQASQVRLPQ